MRTIFTNMKQRKLNIIISFMTAAVIGLLAVQGLWITKSVEIEKERFYKNVNEALLSIVCKIEKKETATIIVKSYSGGKDLQEEHVDTIITSEDVYFMSEEKEVINRLEFKTPQNLSKMKLPTPADSSEHLVYVESKDKMNIRRFLINVDVDSFVTRKTTIINDLIEELLIKSSNKSIAERIDEKMLSSVIKSELNRYGINMDFDYAVQDSRNDSLYFVSNKTNSEELKNTAYKAQLFPDEVFNKPGYLLLNFPDKELYYLKSIQSLLFLSLGLFLFIVGIFYQTARTLFKQKKVGDIKNDLINNITHEFKTPLSTISLTCEALKEPEIIADEDTVKRYHEIIRSEKDRLQKMVEVLLNTAMFERDKLELNLQPVNLNDFLKSEIKKYDLTLERLNGKVTYDLCPGNSFLLIDVFHFANVISNIMDNAVKYSEKDPDIIIRTKEKNDFIEISIEDKGIGLSRKDVNKVFDTFYRVPTGDIQNVKGFGIGLSYAKKIVETHGGKITLVSIAGAGTTVIISMPINGVNNES